MKKNNKNGFWENTKMFLNSTFAAWFFPSVIILSLGFWIKHCKNDAIKKDITTQMVKEINTRIKFAKIRFTHCKDVVQKTGSTGSKTNDYYQTMISNLLLPFPTFEDIDSIDYSPKFRNENMSNLLHRLKTLDERYSEDVNTKLWLLDTLKEYYRSNNQINKSTFYSISLLLSDSLKEIDLK